MEIRDLLGRICLFAAAIAGWIMATPPIGRTTEPVMPVDATVQPASANGPARLPDPDATSRNSSSPRQVVRFRLRAAQIGDRAVQRLGVHLMADTKIMQSGQVANESKNEMRRQQQRTIEVLGVTEGRATKARATFQVCRRQSPDQAVNSEPTPQPIEGKGYLMTRKGEELSITDLHGAIPPLEEYKLVLQALDGVGKPNPLAALLAQRPIAVGETIHVPSDVAPTLLGLGDQLGTVKRFDLTLESVEPATAERASPLGVFRANIEVVPGGESPLSMNLSGNMAVETGTCRLLATDLSGAVGLSSTEQTAGGSFQYNVAGQIQVAIRAQYGPAAGE